MFILHLQLKHGSFGSSDEADLPNNRLVTTKARATSTADRKADPGAKVGRECFQRNSEREKRREENPFSLRESHIE